jgi:hypothetical protein
MDSHCLCAFPGLKRAGGIGRPFYRHLERSAIGMRDPSIDPHKTCPSKCLARRFRARHANSHLPTSSLVKNSIAADSTWSSSPTHRYSNESGSKSPLDRICSRTSVMFFCAIASSLCATSSQPLALSKRATLSISELHVGRSSSYMLYVELAFIRALAISYAVRPVVVATDRHLLIQGIISLAGPVQLKKTRSYPNRPNIT